MGPEQDEAFWNIRTFSRMFRVFFLRTVSYLGNE